MATVEIYFDFTCPFAYLGSTQIERVCEEVGADLIWRPFLLGGVFRKLYGSAAIPTPPASKARHTADDLRRWAALWDVPLRYPSGHPLRSVEALRAVLHHGDAAVPLIHRIYKAYWDDNVDVGDPDVFVRLVDEVGLSGAETLERVRQPDLRQALFDATDEAHERGVFGAPTFFIDGSFRIWGQDRLDFVRRAAQGWRPEGD